jgi:tetratricopeptide (TPR) repeat protein
MRKAMMMAAMATLATSAFGQTAAEQAAKLNQECQDQYQIYVKNSTIEATNALQKEKTPFDTLAMYKGGVAALKAAIECDKYDSQPNEKGKVKLRYRKDNQTKGQQLRLVSLQAGQYFNSKKDNAATLEAFKLYVDSKDASLFTGLDMSKDDYIAQFAYYASLLGYQTKDFDLAIKYAQKCKEYADNDISRSPDNAKVKEEAEKLKSDADEIILFAKKDNCKTAADSAAFVSELKALHKAKPEVERYFNMLITYYNEHPQGKLEWISEEVQLMPNNKMAWAIKGETEMRAEKWDDAVASYKKAVEIDPNFTAVVFNIGTSLNSKAIEVKDKLADKSTGKLTVANVKKVNSILEEAKTYLLKAKELDPERKTVNWAYALYQVYYSLKDTANANAMEKLLNQ